MPRFVILRHELPADADRPSHYDVMFEAGEALRTWAVVERPDAGGSQAAEQLADHRLEYLTYEGPVSGNRGVVTRWEEGSYEEFLPLEATVVFQAAVRGKRLHGKIFITTDGRYSFTPEFPSPPRPRSP